MGKKKTKEEFLADLYSKYNNRYLLIGDYINSNTKTEFQCNVCKDIFLNYPSQILCRGGCPVCSGKKILKGYNDLATLRPDIAQCWIRCLDDETITPEDVTIGSHKRVLWKCPTCNAEHATTVGSRCKIKGCKRCGDKIGRQKIVDSIIQTKGSVADNYPELVDEWVECISNKTKTPKTTTCRCNELVKWKCLSCGHEWDALVSDRTDGHGCPVCMKKQASKIRIQKKILNNGSLNDAYPELAKEIVFFLDDEELTPNQVTLKCHKNAMWECSTCGFMWTTSVLNRVYGSECPNCVANRKNSNLQNKVADYLYYWYGDILNERQCTLKCYNPKTNKLLPYDNEIYIYGKHLIIEVNGEQHYKISGFHKLKADDWTTPEEILEYQQWRDQYKKEYALQHGYEYLEIPYWAEENDVYMDLIDKKMEQIFNNKGD